MLVGVNVVVQSVSLRGAGADGGEALPLCVTLGSLQPVVLSLKRDCGVFGLSTDPACLALLTQGSRVATPLSVLVLNSSSSQSVMGVGTVNTIELVNMSERDNYSSLYAPEPCLQLPSLLLSTALVTVPLVRSPGVATHLGTVTLRVAVFDMTKRAVDALCVFPTGRLAQRRLERLEESRSHRRALPPSLLSRPAPDEPSDTQHHNYYDFDDDAHQDEDERGTDALLSSLEGILAARRSTDSLRLSSILPPSLTLKDAAAAAAAAASGGVSDSTLSLDVILAEMAAEEAKRREAQAQAQAQKSIKAGAAAKGERGATAAAGKPRAKPKANRPTAKAPSKQGKENSKPNAANVKAPDRPSSAPSAVVKASQVGAPPRAKAKAKGKGKVGVGPSRVTVLLKKGEVPPSDTGAPSAPPAPPAPSKQQVDSDFYTRLAAAVEGALDVSMVDSATAARIRERQLRASLSLPVRFKDTPLLVLSKCDPPASPAALAKAAARERRAIVEAARRAKAKAEKEQEKLQRKGGTRETVMRVDMGKLS